MKAITQTTYGDPDVLELTDITLPAPSKGQVLVEVRAAACGPDVWHISTGRPHFARLFLGLRKPRTPARGRDVAGVVSAVGPGVTSLRPGDEVFGTSTSGSFAEYALCDEARLALKPESLTFVDAAAVPVSGGTALQAIQAAGVTAGSRVLVLGAGGGVGTYAVQIAVAYGATVTGMCSAGKAELVRGLGASEVLDYATTEVDHAGPAYDVIIDTAGNRPISLLRRAMTPNGTLVIIGGEQHVGPVMGGFQRSLGAGVVSLFVSQKLVGLVSSETRESYDELARLADAGQLRSVVDRTYPLADAADAVRQVGTGHTTGKLVITI